MIDPQMTYVSSNQIILNPQHRIVSNSRFSDHSKDSDNTPRLNQTSKPTEGPIDSQTPIGLAQDPQFRPINLTEEMKQNRISNMNKKLRLSKQQTTEIFINKVESSPELKRQRQIQANQIRASAQYNLNTQPSNITNKQRHQSIESIESLQNQQKIIHVFPKKKEVPKPKVQEKMTQQMREFVQQGIEELDELMEQNIKKQIEKRRMFQDPILFQEESEDEETNVKKQQPKPNSKRQQQQSITSQLARGLQNMMKPQKLDVVNAMPPSGKRNHIRKMQQFDMQISDLKRQINEIIEMQSLEMEKQKKKKIEDSDTDDQKDMHDEDELIVMELKNKQRSPLGSPYRSPLPSPNHSPRQSPLLSPNQSPKLLAEKKKKQAKQLADQKAEKFAANFVKGLLKSAQLNNKKAEKIYKLQSQLDRLEKMREVVQKIAHEKKIKHLMKKKASIDGVKFDGLKNTVIADQMQAIKQAQFLDHKPHLAAKLKLRGKAAQEKVEYKSKHKVKLPKNYWQFLVRKHILVKRKGLNMVFLSRVVNMQDKLEQMLGTQSIGARYKENSLNMWRNDFLFDFQSVIQSEGQDFDIATQLVKEDGSVNFKELFSESLKKIHFFEQAKIGQVKNEKDEEAIAAQFYFEQCRKLREKPLPTYARLSNNCMFLSEFRFSNAMADTLKQFFGVKNVLPENTVKKLFIDDCGMKDHQFAAILEGLICQDNKLKTIVYSSNDLGKMSIQALNQLVPSLRELQINNVAKMNSPMSILGLLNNFLENGIQLQKLKLSNVIINDDYIVNCICKLIQEKQYLSHYDLSWTGLQPKQLLLIANTLLENPYYVKNINLSYNSLYFDDNNKEYDNSELFQETICEFVSNSKVLQHIDFSGMGFQRDQILPVAQAISSSEGLLAAHLNDLGLVRDRELSLEILDMFGISSESFDNDEPSCQLNRRTHNPNTLRNIVKQKMNILSSKEVNEQDNMEAQKYQKHIVQAKQGRTINKDKLINQTQHIAGLGRIESSLVDQFILSRNGNEPELIFNQNQHKDLYFEQDSSELWRLSLKNECHICQKHKTTYIFYTQPFPEGSEFYGTPTINDDLVEITDRKSILSIKEEINLNFSETYNKKEANPKLRGEIAPYITGTIMKGGFSRKLKMLRADLFATLSVCQSQYYATSYKQSKCIKAGIEQFVQDSQNILVEDCLDFYRGWEQILDDKCRNNTVTDIQNINIPASFHTSTPMNRSLSKFPKYVNGVQQKQKEPECRTYVYAAYLPPGLHQFIIFDPVSERAFCKDIIIDLNCQDPYPEFPLKFSEEAKDEIPVKRTRANVWRKWKDPKPKEMAAAVVEDMAVDFDPSLFIKNPEDVEKCKEVLRENFEMLRIAYLEGQAISSMSFPEISMEKFITNILQMQVTEEMQRRLPRAHIENCFIRATRGDVTQGQGTLCRGEYMEVLLRLCASMNPKQDIALNSTHLKEFLKDYIEPIALQSTFLAQRKEIRESKQLNQLLFDNMTGIKRLYTENKDATKGFCYKSATNVMISWQVYPNALDALPQNIIFESFVKCQMTNCHDLSKQDQYLELKEVEFLEFLTRVAMAHFALEEDLSIPEKVMKLFEKMWEFRAVNKPKVDPKEKKKRRKKFPKLKPLVEDSEESD